MGCPFINFNAGQVFGWFRPKYLVPDNKQKVRMWVLSQYNTKYHIVCRSARSSVFIACMTVFKTFKISRLIFEGRNYNIKSASCLLSKVSRQTSQVSYFSFLSSVFHQSATGVGFVLTRIVDHLYQDLLTTIRRYTLSKILLLHCCWASSVPCLGDEERWHSQYYTYSPPPGFFGYLDRHSLLHVVH